MRMTFLNLDRCQGTISHISACTGIHKLFGIFDQKINPISAGYDLMGHLGLVLHALGGVGNTAENKIPQRPATAALLSY